MSKVPINVVKLYLYIFQISSSDVGPYRCRVDFAQAPTKNSKVMLTLIGTTYLLMT